MSNPPLLLCRPVDLAPLLALMPDLPTDLMPKKYPGSIEGTCKGCGATVWIGPEQQKILGQPGVDVACFTCAALAQQAGAFNPLLIQHLGNTDDGEL